MLIADLPPFGNITALANLVSIVEHGICSLAETHARALTPVSIADDAVQDRREAKRNHGLPLHSYACLYFDPRNPMLLMRSGEVDDIGVLYVDPAVLDLPGVRVTNMNASRDKCRDFPVPEGLVNLDEALIFAESWHHPNESEAYKRKGAKCAEVLVPGTVPPEYILELVVGSQAAYEAAIALSPPFPVRIDQYLFFDAGRARR